MAGSFSGPQQDAGRQKRYRKAGVLVEPPAMLLADIAFVLLLFFVALASNDPTQGRKQDIPRGENKGGTGPAQNLEVSLARDKVSINNVPVLPDDFVARLQAQLAGKSRTEDRIVVVRSTKDTPYASWVRVTSLIEQAGGIVTLQLEDEHVIRVQ